MLSASGDGGDEGDDHAAGQNRVHLVEVADVLVVDEDVDVLTQLPVREQLRADRRVLPHQVVEGFLDGRSRDFDVPLSADQIAHRGRDFYFESHNQFHPKGELDEYRYAVDQGDELVDVRPDLRGLVEDRSDRSVLGAISVHPLGQVHYDARAQGRFCGPVLDGSAGVSVLWPAGVGPCAFVYVRSEYPYVEPLVRSLVALGCKAVLHVPGLAPAAAAHMSTPRVVFSAAAVRMDEVLAHADFVVCHGGSGTTHTVLMAGKPLLLLPTQTEQIMQARRIAALGAAIMIAPTPTTPVFTKALERVMHGGTLLSSAAAFAASHKDHNVLACVENLGARCEALL